MKPCIRCGEPSPATRCDDCAPTAQYVPKTSARERGYGTAHDRLSRRARRLQPFCSWCGATENLQLHHTEEAWRRHNDRKPPRLKDYLVLCATCNKKAGSTREPRGEGPTRVARDSAGQAQNRFILTSRDFGGGGDQ